MATARTRLASRCSSRTARTTPARSCSSAVLAPCRPMPIGGRYGVFLRDNPNDMLRLDASVLGADLACAICSLASVMARRSDCGPDMPPRTASTTTCRARRPESCSTARALLFACVACAAALHVMRPGAATRPRSGPAAGRAVVEPGTRNRVTPRRSVHRADGGAAHSGHGLRRADSVDTGAQRACFGGQRGATACGPQTRNMQQVAVQAYLQHVCGKVRAEMHADDVRHCLPGDHHD